VGDAINLATGSPIDLSRPDREIFVECRQERAYVFVDKVRGAGGLPLGSGGRALAILKGRKDLLATWLVMRRGITPILYSRRASLAKPLEGWIPKAELHREIYNGIGSLLSGGKRYKTLSVIAGSLSTTEIGRIRRAGFLVLRPLVGLDASARKNFEKIAAFHPKKRV
jgi:hypothetical protein